AEKSLFYLSFYFPIPLLRLLLLKQFPQRINRVRRILRLLLQIGFNSGSRPTGAAQLRLEQACRGSANVRNKFRVGRRPVNLKRNRRSLASALASADGAQEASDSRRRRAARRRISRGIRQRRLH